MKLKLVILSTLFTLLTANLQLLAKEPPFELTSDGDTKVADDGTAIAKNNAQIKYDGITVQADQIEYNPKTGEARLFTFDEKTSNLRLVATIKVQRK